MSRRTLLSNLDVADLIEKNGIKCDPELLEIANEQKQEGKKDLADFVLSRSSKSLNDLIHQTWKMKDASSTLQHRFLPFHSMPEEKQKEMIACSKCFAEVVFRGE